jgi:hypothetical protein
MSLQSNLFLRSGTGSRFARPWILVGCTLLAGCGFSPVYAKKQTQATPLLAGVQIDPVSSPNRRMSQQFQADLEDQLNPGSAGNPPYRLRTTLKSNAAAIGVAPDGTISRYNVFLNSSYILYRNADGKRMASGNVSHVSSYNNVSNAYFSTYIAEQDAIKRGVAELAQLYRQRLAAYLSQNGGEPMPQAEPAPDEMPGQEEPLNPVLN